MRDLFIISKDNLDIDECFNLIKETYKDAQKLNDEICVAKPPRSFYLWFPSSLRGAEKTSLTEDELKDVPKDYKFFTNLEFHFSGVAKNVVQALSKKFADLIIMLDCGTVYSADSFIKENFDF